ncbi:bifunctional Serine-threonine-protein kinase [Babesia duncani]|uniref:non-specific serine/threonine protein kinase n=1 Tax=Babesia duncani TaxID=323732 RepID=A0AAD9UQA1_9APIC|nr:bifunctional Serine-threonine-protein kinase [Babesia duncani]
MVLEEVNVMQYDQTAGDINDNACLPIECFNEVVSGVSGAKFEKFGYEYCGPASSGFSGAGTGTIHYVTNKLTNELCIAKVFDLYLVPSNVLFNNITYGARLAQYLSLSEKFECNHIQKQTSIETTSTNSSDVTNNEPILDEEGMDHNNILKDNDSPKLCNGRKEHMEVLKQITPQVSFLKNLQTPPEIFSEEKMNIVRQLDWFMIDKFTMVLVYEYCKGGELFNKIAQVKKENSQQFSEQYILELFREICLGVSYIHNRNIVHGDLKCCNIFFSNVECTKPKIGDFETARHLKDCTRVTMATTMYMPPEMILDQRCNATYKQDIWALGCILYELATFSHPFKIPCTFNQMREQFCMFTTWKRKLLAKVNKVYNGRVCLLLDRLLEFDPNKRPTIQQVLTLMK